MHAIESTQSVNTVECPTLPYKSRLGYRVLIGSWLTDPNIVFRYSKQKIRVQTPCSLSLSLSLYYTILLRPAIKVCKLIQKIIRCAWSGANKHTKSYNLVRLCVRWSRNISDKYLLSDACHRRIQREDRGSGPPEKSQNIGFPSNIDPDPLKITKVPSQHSMVGHWHASKTPFQRRFADGPMVVNFKWHFGPLWQNVLDPRMHTVCVNRLDWTDIISWYFGTYNVRQRLRVACAMVHSQFSIDGYGMSSMQMD